MNQTLHRVATNEREEIKRTTKQEMARRHNKEGGNHLDQESNRPKKMEDTRGEKGGGGGGATSCCGWTKPSKAKGEKVWYSYHRRTETIAAIVTNSFLVCSEVSL